VAGLFSTDERLARALLDAAEGTGEGLWRLPLKPLHDELVRSEVADVKNSLEAPPGGALTAAAFLHTFVGETPWAHLDIAGTAYVTPLNSKWVPPYHPPGYVAFGVRLVTEYLQEL
jgi:leucyl aminopeptidase